MYRKFHLPCASIFAATTTSPAGLPFTMIVIIFLRAAIPTSILLLDEKTAAYTSNTNCLLLCFTDDNSNGPRFTIVCRLVVQGTTFTSRAGLMGPKLCKPAEPAARPSSACFVDLHVFCYRLQLTINLVPSRR